MAQLAAAIRTPECIVWITDSETMDNKAQLDVKSSFRNGIILAHDNIKDGSILLDEFCSSQDVLDLSATQFSTDFINFINAKTNKPESGYLVVGYSNNFPIIHGIHTSRPNLSTFNPFGAAKDNPIMNFLIKSLWYSEMSYSKTIEIMTIGFVLSKSIMLQGYNVRMLAGCVRHDGCEIFEDSYITDLLNQAYSYIDNVRNKSALLLCGGE